MEHIKVERNDEYNFYTLTADDGYIISNTRDKFDVENYTGVEKMVTPLSVDPELFIAISKELHEQYLKLVDMYHELSLDKPSIVV